MSRRSARHAIWFLIFRGAYGYGDHVDDAHAFVARARRILQSEIGRLP